MMTNGIINQGGRAYLAPRYEVTFSGDSRWEARTNHRGVPQQVRMIRGTVRKREGEFWVECDRTEGAVLHFGAGRNRRVAVTDAILSRILAEPEKLELQRIS